MKRHSSLIPLSREHHDGLLLATRLQQGKKALPRLWSHDLHWQAHYVVAFFDDHLDRHFRIEEEIVFPTAKKFLKDKSDTIAQLLDEHEEVKKLVESLRTPSLKNLEDALILFGQVLEKHIRTEEREFFPLCEEQIPTEELEKMGRSVKQHDKKFTQ